MTLTVALVGNPNCGKSTVFNALTGSNQRIGNWPGVTVERKTGTCQYKNQFVEVIDLPGTYSLTSVAEQQCLDEKIACEFLLSDEFDLVVNIIDATNLERNLFLTSQLLEMGLAVIVVLNMTDIAEKRQIRIDSKKLSTMIGCPVLTLDAKKEKGLPELKKMMLSSRTTTPTFPVQYPPLIKSAVTDLSLNSSGARHGRTWCALQLLEGDYHASQHITSENAERVKEWLRKIQNELGEDADILIADARYTWAHELAKNVETRKLTSTSNMSTKIDNVVLHRWFGIPLFLFVMYVMFFFAINVGGAFQDLFDKFSEAIFVRGSANILHYLGSPNWLIAVLSSGAGRGINTTLTFIPVIGAMFLFLSLLESSGYMSRASFVVDRLMRVMGLPGKSFVPMIVGFGCNVPAIMAARTLDNKRDRVLTIMMSPFMSCGARLAIYAVFTAAFFPVNGHNVVFLLYVIGVLMAMFTGFILRKTILRGDPSELVMEMPAYHLPRWSVICSQTWFRLQSFIVRAGKLIVPVCMLIGSLNAIPVTVHHQKMSALAAVGKVMSPLVKPMGVQENNWPATVGLVSGVLSKEVVVATLNTLYSQDPSMSLHQHHDLSVHSEIKEALMSVPKNISQLATSLLNPISASAPVVKVDEGVYGVMYERFGSGVAAFAYLLFVLLYFPCISATAAMVRELNRSWALFSALWTTSIAYGVAVLFYQSMTLSHHVLSSIVWIALMISLFIGTIVTLKNYTLKEVSPCT